MDYAYSYVNTAPVLVEMFSSSFSLTVNVLMIVAWWFLFKKAGEAGWKILIPFYGSYMQFKVAGCPHLFWYAILVPVLGAFVGAMLILSEIVALIVLGVMILLAVVVTAIVIQAKFCKRLALAYGKPTSFAVGLFFLQAIFVCILAFDKSEYQLNRIQG